MVNGKWKHRSYNVVFVQTHIIRHGKMRCVARILQLYTHIYIYTFFGFRQIFCFCNERGKGTRMAEGWTRLPQKRKRCYFNESYVCGKIMCWDANVKFFGWTLIPFGCGKRWKRCAGNFHSIHRVCIAGI